MWGQDVTVTFNSSSDVGTGTAASGNNSVAKEGITISCTAGGFAIFGGAHYRLASNSTTTISSTVGHIKSIVITGPSGTGSNSISKFGTNSGWTLNSTSGTYTWSGDAESVSVKANSGQVRPTSIAVTYTPTSSGLTTSDLALTGAPVALNFDLYNNSSAQTVTYTTSSTGAVTVTGGTSYVTTSLNSGTKTITVTPTAVTPSTQTITVSQEADATYAAGSVTFTVNVTDSTPLPTHTATFSVNGATSTQDFEEGAAITFPSDPAAISGKSFVGWLKNSTISGTTNEAPSTVNKSTETMGNSDVTYYAVFADVTSSGSSSITLDNSTIQSNATGKGSYSNDYNIDGWTGRYMVNNNSGSYSLQLGYNADSNKGAHNSHLTTPNCAGSITSITIATKNGTASGRTFYLCSANNLGTASSENATYGYGSTTSSNGSVTISVTGAPTQFHIYPDGTSYLESVTLNYASTSYSNYCTTVAAATVATPMITVAENPFLISTTAEITCATTGATIYYTLDGIDPTTASSVYSTAIPLTATTTIKAFAVKDANESAVASFTATKNLATPTVTIDADITNTDVYVGISAGSLTASVTYNNVDVEGANVNWSGNNDDVATINASTGAVTLVAAGTVTFTATYAGNSDYAEASSTYEMTVTTSEPAGVFYKVTDVSKLDDGHRIAIVNEDHNVAMSTTQNTNNRGEVSIILDDDHFEATTSVQVITLEHLTTNWRLNTGNGYLYAASNTANHLKTQSTANDNNSIVAISISGGDASMVFQGENSHNDLRYNSGSNIFSCYSTGNSQGVVQIYRQEVPVSIGSAGFATFSSTYALDFSKVSSVYAYTATVAGDAITFNRVNKVPANTGVLLYSTNEGAVTATVPVFTGTADDVTGNLFVAATTEIASLASESDGYNNYILNVVNNVVGFYRAAGNKVGAGKAYLAVPKTLPVRSFVALPGGINTGIQTSDNLTIGQSDNCYDLQGRRISTPKNGLYIVNGKKVLLH